MSVLDKLSVRASLVVTVGLLAALGVGLAIMASEVYHRQALENERQDLGEYLRLQFGGLQRQLEHEAKSVAYDLRRSGSLAQHLVAPRAAALELLTDRAVREAAAEGRARPTGVALYDAQLRPLTASGMPAPFSGCLPSPVAPSDAATLPKSWHCLDGGRPYYSVLVPIPGNPAVVQVVTDLIPRLAEIESATQLPVRLALERGELLYESPAWPDAGAVSSHLLVDHFVRFQAPGRIGATLTAARDVRGFYDRLSQTRTAVMAITLSVTLFVAMLAVAFLEKTALAPLRRLTEQLRRVHEDASHLGKRVEAAGSREAVELARHFNEMTTKLEALYGDLERAAFTDTLTQLPNRSLFREQLDQTLAVARQERQPIALLVLDLDRFKDINDTLGQHVGDMLLQQVALRLRGKLRETDVLARMGADEFAILLPAVDGKQADMAARMLLQALRAPFMVDEHRLDIGTSVGISLYPDHGIDAHTLIQRADLAMRAAKQAGSGHAQFDERLDAHQPARLALLGDLHEAIEQEQFRLYFQPIVRLRTKRVVSVEALARWHHPSGELMLPDRFLPLLEQTGLVRRFTSWVLGQALSTVRELQARGLAVPLAVNLSLRDLQDPYLPDELAELLAAHQVAPSWLEFEIGEAALTPDARTALETLPRLAAMGFRIAVDDFGTGYSSLASLKRLPVSSMKIDRSFVTGLGHDANNAAIVRTSVELAHSLGLTVVAEGVDDAETLTRLRADGCDAVQGLYVARPLASDELFDWLVKSTWGLSEQALAHS